MKKVLSNRWNHTLESGATLRRSIDEGDLSGIIRNLQSCYKELLNAKLIDEYQYESYTEDFEMYLDSDLEDYEDPEDVVDYELNNFYDLCDNLHVWIPVS